MKRLVIIFMILYSSSACSNSLEGYSSTNLSGIYTATTETIIRLSDNTEITSTVNPSPTVTLSPTITPSPTATPNTSGILSNIDSPVLKFIDNISLNSKIKLPLSLSTGDWDYDNVSINDNGNFLLEISSGKGHLLHNSEGVKFGEGVLVKFKTNQKSSVWIGISQGTLSTISSRVWGIRGGKDELSPVFQNQYPETWGDYFNNNIKFKPNEWFYIFLGRNDEGKLIQILWEENDPSNYRVGYAKLNKSNNPIYNFWAGHYPNLGSGWIEIALLEYYKFESNLIALDNISNWRAEVNSDSKIYAENIVKKIREGETLISPNALTDEFLDAYIQAMYLNQIYGARSNQLPIFPMTTTNQLLRIEKEVRGFNSYQSSFNMYWFNGTSDINYAFNSPIQIFNDINLQHLYAIGFIRLSWLDPSTYNAVSIMSLVTTFDKNYKLEFDEDREKEIKERHEKNGDSWDGESVCVVSSNLYIFNPESRDNLAGFAHNILEQQSSIHSGDVVFFGFNATGNDYGEVATRNCNNEIVNGMYDDWSTAINMLIDGETLLVPIVPLSSISKSNYSSYNIWDDFFDD